MPDLLTIDEALTCIREHAQLLPAEAVAVADAAGRVLREPAVSRVDLPPFASSAMDGFAVRAAETPGEVPVAFRVPAGSPSLEPLPARAAAGIATGSAVPEGADAVVPVERVVDHGDRVEILEPAVTGQHIRPRGGDAREGDVAASAGTRLGAAHIGALAAVGIGEVQCSVRPRVAVLATGSELRPAGESLAFGQIYESNREMIATVLRAAGADVKVMPVVEDDEGAHQAALERGLAADVLVTSGGVSMGPHDLVRRVAADLGVEEVFWGVAIKPGKPLSFGVRGATLVFGLPGNPVSSLVGSLVFARPALLERQGLAGAHSGYEHGRSTIALRRNPQRDEFVRARRRLDEDAVVLTPVTGQESHMIVRAAAADALIHVPRGGGEIAAGTPIRYLRIE
ncbi:MAG: molybdopterin molybdotransferase MoeA [Thermoleophilia bacterium]|nr:molybdopterin molybdotransferase MoeA [Thermoleophilia bacterium]